MILTRLQSEFIEITLGHEGSPANLQYIFETAFPQNTSGGLLLKITEQYHQNSCKQQNLHSSLESYFVLINTNEYCK